MIVAFSGHRPDKIGGHRIPNPTYISICQQTDKILRELQPEKAICGMALGYDQYAAFVCIKLGIPFVAAVPFIGQEKIWPELSQKAYNFLLSKASDKVFICEGAYEAKKMQIRNQWMTDRCDLLIACWDGSSGGTANCIAYAKSISKPIRRIVP